MKKTFYLVALYLLSAQVKATIWTIDFSGTLNNINEYLGEISVATKGEHNFHEGRFYLGQEFRGSVILDDSVGPSSSLAADPERDIYSSLIDQTVNIGGFSYSKGNPYPSFAQVWNRGDPETFKDVFSTSGNNYNRPFEIGLGRNLSSLTISMFDRDGDVFNSSSLKSALTKMAQMDNVVDVFEYHNFGLLHISTGDDVVNQYLFLNGNITTLSVSRFHVNTPSILGLFLATIAVLGLSTRKKSKLGAQFMINETERFDHRKIMV